MSQSAIASSIAARAVAAGQSRARWLVSNETIAPAARAARIAAKHVSRAVAEIASEIPDRCKTRVCANAAAGSCTNVSRLAAEPVRKKWKW